MRIDRRRSLRGAKQRALCCGVAALWVASGVSVTGCQSGPIRAFQGARHYAAGTEALERSESAFAIRELEAASVLVPHSSEIQNHLGLAYWAEGELVSARVAFERAIEIDCDNESARLNLERIVRAPEAGPLGSIGRESAGGDSARAGRGDDSTDAPTQQRAQQAKSEAVGSAAGGEGDGG